MQRVSLSPEGPEVSRIAWGAWRLAKNPRLSDGSAGGIRALREFVDLLIEHGITTVDHADIYGGYRSEAIFGRILGERPTLREHLQIVTKCGIRSSSAARSDVRVGHYDTSSEHITASVESSLKKLAVETIDLLLVHRPDPLMDPDETAGALTRLRDSGKIRFAGVSNHSPSQFELLQSRLDFPLVTNQIELSALHHAPFTDGTLDHSQTRRIRPMAWSPLAGGRLLGGADEEAALRVRDALQSVARRYPGSSSDQIALAWLLRHPSGPVPILGTGKPDRLVSAVGALDVDLDRQSWFEIYVAALGHPVP